LINADDAWDTFGVFVYTKLGKEDGLDSALMIGSSFSRFPIGPMRLYQFQKSILCPFALIKPFYFSIND